jgi:hypothetical protein
LGQEGLFGEGLPRGVPEYAARLTLGLRLLDGPALQSEARLEVAGQALHFGRILARQGEGEDGQDGVAVEEQGGVAALVEGAVGGGGNAPEAVLLGQGGDEVGAVAGRGGGVFRGGELPAVGEQGQAEFLEGREVEELLQASVLGMTGLLGVWRPS